MGRAEEDQEATGKAGTALAWGIQNQKRDPGTSKTQHPLQGEAQGDFDPHIPAVPGTSPGQCSVPMYPSQEHGTQTQSMGALCSLTAARQEQGTLPGKADYSPHLELIRACLN